MSPFEADIRHGGRRRAKATVQPTAARFETYD
jgi:hypothetical protein